MEWDEELLYFRSIDATLPAIEEIINLRVDLLLIELIPSRRLDGPPMGLMTRFKKGMLTWTRDQSIPGSVTRDLVVSLYDVRTRCRSYDVRTRAARTSLIPIKVLINKRI